jgi:hypothetical protein
MEITVRDLMTVVHGMGFGALFMLAFSGAIGVIYSTAISGARWEPGPRDSRMFRFYLISMVVLAWLTVISGSYIVYPWYRAIPPTGTTDLAAFPQRLLLSSPMTAGWHDFGMEWKEHIAWFGLRFHQVWPAPCPVPRHAKGSARIRRRCLRRHRCGRGLRSLPEQVCPGPRGDRHRFAAGQVI